jgi:polygalacturonase
VSVESDKSSGTVFNIVTDCGAVGDNSTMNTDRIQRCIQLAETQSGTVVVPEGVYLTGGVTISGDGVTLIFNTGGYLQGSSHSNDYVTDWDYWHVVTVVNATNFHAIGSSGSGIIGNLWGMVAGWNPQQEMLVPAPWTGVGGCVGECRVKNIALIDVKVNAC